VVVVMLFASSSRNKTVVLVVQRGGETDIRTSVADSEGCPEFL
jgi:hypothetical protein